MTVIAAVLDRQRGCVALGADRQLTMGTFKSRAEPKVVNVGGALLAIAGAHLFRRFWHEVEGPGVGTDVDVLAWCWYQQDRFRAWVREHGHGQVQNSLHGVELWAIVAAPSGLYELSGTGDVTCTQEPYAVAGAGAGVAAGALHALLRRCPDLPPAILVQDACEAACAHEEGCSGPVHVLTLCR